MYFTVSSVCVYMGNNLLYKLVANKCFSTFPLSRKWWIARCFGIKILTVLDFTNFPSSPWRELHNCFFVLYYLIIPYLIILLFAIRVTLILRHAAITALQISFIKRLRKDIFVENDLQLNRELKRETSKPFVPSDIIILGEARQTVSERFHGNKEQRSFHNPESLT